MIHNHWNLNWHSHLSTYRALTVLEYGACLHYQQWRQFTQQCISFTPHDFTNQRDCDITDSIYWPLLCALRSPRVGEPPWITSAIRTLKAMTRYSSWHLWCIIKSLHRNYNHASFNLTRNTCGCHLVSNMGCYDNQKKKLVS